MEPVKIKQSRSSFLRNSRHGGARPSDPEARFLTAAREIFAASGLKGLTFDAVATRLGVSKQAVIHWYPTKSHLLAALVLPDLQAEADKVVMACKNSRDDAPLKAALLTLAEHHLDDLERFRMLYLAPQTGVGIDFKADPAVADGIHRITGMMYGALAAAIDPDSETARREAVSLHAAVIGILTMVSLGERIGDPLKHDGMSLAESMIRHLVSGRTI